MVCGPAEISLKLNGIIDDYFNHPATRKIVGTDGDALKKMYRAVTGQDFDFGDIPTLKDLNKLSSRLKKFQTRLLKGAPGKIAELFYLPEEFLKGNPDAAKTFDSFVISHNYYRGTKSNLLRGAMAMAASIRRLAQRQGIYNASLKGLGVGRQLRNAGKELEIMYNDYKAMKSKEMSGEKGKFTDSKNKVYASSEEFYSKNLKDLGKKEQFKLYELTNNLLRNPKLISKPEYAPLKPVLDEWTKMRPKLFKELKNGLEKYINILSRDSNSELYENTISRLQDLNKELIPENNYFPTEVLNIFPTMKKIQDTIYESKTGDINETSFTDLNTYVDNMVNNVIRRIPVSDHTKEKLAPPETRYNKNVFGVLDRYINEVTKFNYMVNITDSLVKGVKNLRNQSNAEVEGSTKVYINYLEDTHAAMLGYGHSNPTFAALSRTITSWQFISKLGLNFRSMARNATQSFQNWVYFGMKGIRESNEYLNNKRMSDIANAEMERHGVFFEDVRELAESVSFPELTTTKINGEDVYTWKADSSLDRLNKGLDEVAKFTGKGMAWVENTLNRKITFKIAFAKMHEQLSSNMGDVRKLIIEKNKSKEGAMDKDEYGDFIKKEVDEHIIRKSSRFAANMVKTLHYEYSGFAKPKVMRSATGAVATQFMTYSFNFFNYQKNIIGEGVSDLIKNDWTGEGAFRMYRLGMLYTAITGLLSLAFNTDFGNLIQNDTVDRGKQAVALLSGAVGIAGGRDYIERTKILESVFGDEKGSKPSKKDILEEFLKSTYGKGLSSAAGPFFSDVLTAGKLAGFYSLFDGAGKPTKEFLAYTIGYEDYAKRRKSDKAYEYFRMLNTQLSRTFLQSIPRSLNGASFGTIANLELGLHSSKEIKEKKAKYIKAAQEIPVVGKHIPTPTYAKKKIKKKKVFNKRTDERLTLALKDLGKVSMNRIGSPQWLNSIIGSSKAYGSALQPLKGNLAKHNNKLMQAARARGYQGDFDQGTWG